MMYLTLRVTRNLIWLILLHAITAPSLFLLTGGIDEIAGTAGDPHRLASLAALANRVVIGLGFVLLFFVRGRVAGDVAPTGTTG